MGTNKVCDYCHGNGTITAWNAKKKTYEVQPCTACKGRGVVNTGTY
jgi:DnaJ-class molecular chaperone